MQRHPSLRTAVSRLATGRCLLQLLLPFLGVIACLLCVVILFPSSNHLSNKSERPEEKVLVNKPMVADETKMSTPCCSIGQKSHPRNREIMPYTSNRKCPDQEHHEICVFRKQLLSGADRFLMKQTLGDCSMALNRMPGSPAYFLYGTTLLGYYRHNHSFIPWEDYINIALIPPRLTADENHGEWHLASLVRQLHRNVRTMIKPRNSYTISYDRNNKIIKCYSRLPNKSRRINTTDPSVFWRWPYVEIQIMNVQRNSEHEIVAIKDPNWSEFYYPSATILPLRAAKFENVPVYVPRDVALAVERTYNADICRSRYYSHRRETSLASNHQANRPCWDLRHFVNFTGIEFFSEFESKAEVCEIGKKADDPQLCAFLPQLNPSQKTVLLKLMSVCIDVLEKIKDASYFLYGGTLIGYWRHNGSLIPWDDDGIVSIYCNFYRNNKIPMYFHDCCRDRTTVDLAVIKQNTRRTNEFYYRQAKKLMRNHPEYDVILMANSGKMKFFGTTSRNSRKIGDSDYVFSWRWPFIDVQLMNTTFAADGKSIVNISDTSEFTNYWYPGELILPLKRASFENMKVWVPANIKATLRRNYNLRECTAPYYSHRFERSISEKRQIVRPCNQLRSLYKFTNIPDSYYDDGGDYLTQ